VAPDIAAAILAEPAAQTAGVTVIAVTRSPVEAVAVVMAAKTVATATMTVPLRKCAGGKPGASEHEGDCKGNYGMTRHFNLFEMLPASASIKDLGS
jgi:hypothetical protein